MARKEVLTGLILLLMFSCQKDRNNFRVSGNLTGKEGIMIHLEEMTVKTLVPVDSAKLDENGFFTLRGHAEMDGFYVLYSAEGDYITLLLGPGDKITLSGNSEKLPETYNIEGSSDSRSVHELSVELNKTLSRIRELSRIFNDSLRSPGFDSIKARLDRTYIEILNSQREFTFRFIRENINSLASLMALYQQVGPHHYVLDPVKDYRWYKMVDSSLTIHFPGSEPVRELHRQVVELNAQQKAEEMSASRFQAGSEVPEIALPSPDGDTIALSSLKGKYVLLDFWASWSEPCRSENPYLVAAYQKYNSMGFEIYQVSLDRSRASWIKAIEDDHLTWANVSDLQYWNSVVVPVYNIQGIPMNFLLDPGGHIIAREISGNMLTEKLKEIFKK
jgi:thiol-disulfide isomerase/thioredoxin